jgi:hypothetical protein
MGYYSNMRSSSRPGLPPLGDAGRALLRAVAAGRIRHEADGGLWSPYELDGADVGGQLRALHRRGLVHLPLAGAPRLTLDGEAALTNFP